MNRKRKWHDEKSLWVVLYVLEWQRVSSVSGLWPIITSSHSQLWARIPLRNQKISRKEAVQIAYGRSVILPRCTPGGHYLSLISRQNNPQLSNKPQKKLMWHPVFRSQFDEKFLIHTKNTSSVPFNLASYEYKCYEQYLQISL